MIRFGPAGNSDSFYDAGYKKTVEMPMWLNELGLDAYEYQCGQGVRVGENTAIQIGEEARKYGIQLSIHAPYFINFANAESQKRENSKKYLYDSLVVAKWMGANRVVFHPGTKMDLDRAVAMSNIMRSLKEFVGEIASTDLSDVYICPELMGKINQMGTLEEIIEMCKISETLIPTIDFGHYNARNHGNIKGIEDYKYVFDYIRNELGEERAKSIHIHFSRIEFTAGGEKKHWTFDDVQFGPDFEPLAELLYKEKLDPVIICESRGTMAEDALRMKNMYLANGEK